MNTTTKTTLSLLASLALVACGDDGATGGQGGQSSTSGSTKATTASSTTTSATSASSASGTGTNAASTSASATATATATATVSSSSSGMSAPPECVMDEDCAINDDCCECAGRPVGEVPPACNVDCQFTVCAQGGMAQPAALCKAGRCVSPIDCNPSVALCDIPPPLCPPGTLPAVAPDNNCWVSPALCMPAIECTSIGTCDNCAGAGVGCVENVSFLGSAHCVTLPSDCAGDDCSCMGPSTCLDPFTACGESDGHITCTCITC